MNQQTSFSFVFVSVIASILILGTISNEDVLQNVYGLVVIDFESFTVGNFLTTQLLTQGIIFDNIEVQFNNSPCWASGTLGNHILLFGTKTLDFVNNADPIFFGTTDFFEVTILDIDRADPVSIRAYDVNGNLLEEKFAIPNPTVSVGLCVQTLTISQSGIARIELDAKDNANGFDNIEFNDVVPTNTLRSTQSSATQALGQTTILGTCGLSFPDGNTVDYGALLPNTICSICCIRCSAAGWRRRTPGAETRWNGGRLRRRRSRTLPRRRSPAIPTISRSI